jgi:hypothetical protein
MIGDFGRLTVVRQDTPNGERATARPTANKMQQQTKKYPVGIEYW